MSQQAMSDNEVIDVSLLNDVQTQGVRISSADDIHVSRKGGAGPSDHQAMKLGDETLMVPIYTQSALTTPYSFQREADGQTTLLKDGIPLKDISFAKEPAFYSLKTAAGIPYKQIATLHSNDVLATTVLQTCIRYEKRTKRCKFCAIGQSLAAGRTIAYKTPSQLAEVAKAAVELDGIKHMVMTTGTPASDDRGCKVLCESVEAVKAAVDIPIQVQCEPPADYQWFQRMKEAGADALGMHIEVVNEQLRKEMIPGKAEITVAEYIEAFKAAVPVFGKAQVSTYLLAGLGDTVEELLALSSQLIDLDVYPFVVPFVPISGTPMEDWRSPSADFMAQILEPLAHQLVAAGLASNTVKAGCSKCGACSSLAAFEKNAKAALRQQSQGGKL